MKKSIYFLLPLIINLNDCTILSSKEAAIGCQIADIFTTARALRLNKNAYEENSIPVDGLYAIKGALIAYIAVYPDWNKEPKELRSFITFSGCAFVPQNLKAAKGN